MKTSKTKMAVWQLVTPLLFVVMILMQAYYLKRSGGQYPDLEVTNRILTRVATPVFQLGLLGLLLIAQMLQMQFRINKLELALEDMGSKDTQGDTKNN